MSITKNVSLPARAWLAPMSGATDAPFRKQAERFGARAVVSEMVAGESLAAGRPDVVRRTLRHEGDGPWIVQLAARRPGDMRDGAQLLVEAGVDIIDINMGCPSKKVTGGQSGSALMRDLDLARAIIEAAMAGADGTPVTLKMRLGWDDDALNAPELAEIAIGCGVRWLTVHGRTRCMFYTGQADWGAIANTVAVSSVPVIANGDIGCSGTARAALDASGADAVMIGRAAMGRPWLIAEIEASLNGTPWIAPAKAEQADSLREQVADSVSVYGVRLGVRTVRKHVSAAIDAATLDIDDTVRRELRSRLCQIEDPLDLDRAIAEVYASTREVAAA